MTLNLSEEDTKLPKWVTLVNRYVEVLKKGKEAGMNENRLDE